MSLATSKNAVWTAERTKLPERVVESDNDKRKYGSPSAGEGNEEIFFVGVSA